MDILQEPGHWSPALTTEAVVLSIQSLLSEPDFDSPCGWIQSDEDIVTAKSHYQEIARQWTQQYAK